MIPVLSLKNQTAALREEVLAGLGRVIDSQTFANGPAVAEFEHALAAYVGCGHAICVNSGTTALHGALLGVGAISRPTRPAPRFDAQPGWPRLLEFVSQHQGCDPSDIGSEREDLKIK